MYEVIQFVKMIFVSYAPHVSHVSHIHLSLSFPLFVRFCIDTQYQFCISIYFSIIVSIQMDGKFIA